MAPVVRWLLVVALAGTACSAPDTHGAQLPTGGAASGAGSPDVAAEPRGIRAAQPLLGHQRQWLLAVQIDLRGAGAVVDTLAAWWRTEELAALNRLADHLETEILAFAARHGAARLAQSWSAIDRLDRPWAERYDRLVRAGLQSRVTAEVQAGVALAAVADTLAQADLHHPEIALMVSTLTERITRQTPTRE